ncbi:PIG-L deacetylase family protein [Neptuniibacter halophilus]|uniref:PIG-L deacetylase family protein n=1 Tax=Neptuniibacter halophilus TaxID=651666 RepID=UPI0025742358|nr:PIG-L deacetylase family protein [Neptuniibacter halophilus]
MRNVLVIAPHADDESLGCGGTLLRHLKEGDSIHWLLITGMTKDEGYDDELISTRQREIQHVASCYEFSSVHELKFPPAALDSIPLGDLISAISTVVSGVEPEIIYVPYRNDAHSDHQVVFDASISSSKSFRYPFVKKVLAYETISETEFGLKPEDGGFKPNIFVDITPYIEQKIRILDIFDSEMGAFPFPRSRPVIEALATLRGAQSNCFAAEAFMLIKEII